MDIPFAVQVYRARQSRSAHPAGHFDKAGRWYPDSLETCPCCASIRTPSRAWPNSLNKHCRSIEHIANLCKVDPSALRKAIRQAQRA